MKNIVIIFMAIMLFSCDTNRLNVDVSDIDAKVELYRFDSLLYANTSNAAYQELSDLYSDHQIFIDLYTKEILKLGEVGTEEFESNFEMFLNDSVYSEVGNEILDVYTDMDDIKQQFESGYKHMLYYFPNTKLPAIYTYASGFNQSLLVANDFIGIALDKYLGADCVFYKYLGIPQYLIKTMYSQRMLTDAFYAWGLTEYPKNNEIDHLLSSMIYQGKLCYYVEAMLPEMPDTVIMGYSGDQLAWCNIHEAEMWTFFVENKLLYSTDKLEIRKYIDNTPYTQAFTNESPGRTGVWIGWQIVRSYMNKNPEVSLAQLMEMHNAQQLLTHSGYFPE